MSLLASAKLTKAETANRTRQRMHAVMQSAWAHGHISANPVSVVDHILPKQSSKAGHQPAMLAAAIPLRQTTIDSAATQPLCRHSLEPISLHDSRGDSGEPPH